MSELKASGMALLAELYGSEGNTERALAIQVTLLNEAPPTAEFEFIHARTLAESGQAAQAEPHLRRAIEIRPDFLQSYLFLGSLLVSLGREPDAADVYAAYESTLAQLLAAAGDAGRPTAERIAIIDSLNYATPDERITQTSLELLQDGSLAIQAAAIQLLANVGTDAAVAPLTAYAELATEPQLVTAAQVALQHIASRAGTEPAPITPAQ
jgi:tetratricopeptide (TPR) repeat protein